MGTKCIISELLPQGEISNMTQLVENTNVQMLTSVLYEAKYFTETAKNSMLTIR